MSVRKVGNVGLLRFIERSLVRQSPRSVASCDRISQRTFSTLWKDETSKFGNHPLPLLFEEGKVTTSFSQHIHGRLIYRPVTTSEEDEVKKIFEITKSKYSQLGIASHSDILKLLTVLEHSKQRFTENDIKTLFDLTSHVVERYYQPTYVLVEKLWKLITSNQVTLSQEQMTYYLQMCMKSYNRISIEDIMKTLKTNNLSFSQEIAELMMANIAHHGDVSGSYSVMSAMKENDLTLNENILSSLIIINGINCNQKGIREVLSMIKSAKLEETVKTDFAMVIAHLYCKEFDVVRVIMDRWKDTFQKLSSAQFSDIVLHFVKSGNFQVYSSILNYILNTRLSIASSADLKKTIIHLIHQNYPVEAIYILLRLSELKRNRYSYTDNSLFIRELVKSECESNVVLQLCDDIRQNEFSSFTFQIALETALKNCQVKLAWDLLRSMKHNKEPIRQHYFWPVLAQLNDHNEILSGIRDMTELGVPPGFETLRSYVIPKLSVEDTDVTLQMLSKAGVTETKAATPLLSVLISKGLLIQAVSFVQKSAVQIDIENLLKPLSKSYASFPEESLQLLNVLVERGNKGKAILRDFGGQWLKDLFSSTEINSDMLRIMEVLKFMKAAEIKISGEICEEVVDLVKSTLQIDVRKQLESLMDEALQPGVSEREKYFIPPPSIMNIDELEAHLKELNSKKMNTRGVLRKLLIKHSNNKNTQRVKELIQEIRRLEQNLSPGMLSTQMKCKIMEGDVDSALEYFYLLNNENPNFLIDSYKVVDLCNVLVKQDRFEDALGVLQHYSSQTPNSFHNKKAILRNCHALLSIIAENRGYSDTKEMTSLLISKGLADPSAVLLGPLIKAKLNSNDLVGAVEAAEEIHTSYKILPMRVELLAQLLKSVKAAKENGPAQRLESDDVAPETLAALIDRMVVLCTSARGFNQAREDLLAASIEAGDETECQRIFKHVEQRLSTDKICLLCNNYVRKEKTESLLMMLKISKDSSKIDRLYICQCLLNIYNVQGSGFDALNLWAIMQEEDVRPTDAFRRKLRNILVATNTALPIEFEQGT